MFFNKYLVIIPGIILAFVLYTLSQGFNNIIGIELLGYSKSPISTAMIAILLGIFFGNIFKIRDGFQKGLDFTREYILNGLNMNLDKSFQTDDLTEDLQQFICDMTSTMFKSMDDAIALTEQLDKEEEADDVIQEFLESNTTYSNLYKGIRHGKTNLFN